MKNQIKKLEKQVKKIKRQINNLHKNISILKEKYYNANIQNNLKEMIIMEKPENQINIFDIANYMIKGKNVRASNLKLNKLIFYFYTKYLVDHRPKLFTSQVQAWRFGPVFPDLYQTFKKYYDKVIKHVPNTTKTTLTQKQTQIINYVVSKYSHYDTWDLIDKIHNEDPWRDTFPAEELYSRRPIIDDKILKYYSKNPI